MFKRHIQVNGIKKGEAYIIHIMNNLNMEQKNMINRNMEQHFLVDYDKSINQKQNCEENFTTINNNNFRE